MQHFECLVVGSGIAGLSTALKFAEAGRALKGGVRVLLVAKTQAEEGSTRYAQGGIAAVWSKQDSFEDHIQDTLVAGAGLCKRDAVEVCVREGPARVQELIDRGVQFTRSHSAESVEEFSLHREGGHGKRRILHSDDLTGEAIEMALLEQVRACPEITLLENFVLIDVIRRGPKRSGPCVGAYLLNHETSEVLSVSADLTVLATGGAGKVYLYTSNPDTATGDGVAAAYRAGARIANMEFYQFHPTCLYHPRAKSFLVTEALRGEGAQLRNMDGEAFMSRYHDLRELAPRDIVARAIDFEMKRTGDPYVLLDTTHLSADELKKKFPNIYERCSGFGIHMSTDPIPVVPAAHYMCGGVWVDVNGSTSIDRLYAVGEVAYTGLHGANRLDSNSLLDGVVFAHRAAEHGLAWLSRNRGETHDAVPLPQWTVGQAEELEEQIDVAASWKEIRTLMWNNVGIVRSNHRLERARRRLSLLKTEIQDYYWDFILTRDLVELRNLVTVAELIVQSAQWRKESRGLHYTASYPGLDDTFFQRESLW